MKDRKKTVLKGLCAVFAAAAIGTGVSACGHTADHRSSPPPEDTYNQLPDDDGICADNTDIASIKENMPELFADLQDMSQLPIMGQPVSGILLSPANNILICEVPADELDGALGTYNPTHNELTVGDSDLDIATMSHESFHAVQDAQGGFTKLDKGTLTYKDTLVGNLLTEASAEAYAFTLYKESEKFHPETDLTFVPAFHDMDMDGIFESAFATAWKNAAAKDPGAREKEALEAGGQAVTLALLEGESYAWTGNYGLLAEEWTTRVASHTGANYVETRDSVYASIAAVNPGFNLLPTSLKGKKAGPEIQKIIRISIG